MRPCGVRASSAAALIPLLLLRLFSLVNIASVCYANIIYSPPQTFEEQPEATSQPGLIGNRRKLNCQADGYPTPSLSWYRDNVLLPNDQSTMYITIQLKYHGSKYMCVARNKLGAIRSNSARIFVGYGQADFQDEQLEVISGQAIVLQVPQIDSYPKIKTTWYTSSSIRVVANHMTYISLTGDRVALLAVTGDSLTSGDLFRAHVKFFDTQANKIFTLTIKESAKMTNTVTELPPSIIVAPVDTVVIVGQSAVLECVANAVPLTKLVITWYLVQNGTRLPLPDSFTRSTYNRRISLAAAAIHHQGVYACTAKLSSPPSGYSYETVSASATLSVLVKPKFTNKPSSELTSDFGSALTIDLITESPVGDNGLYVEWFKDAQHIDDERYTVNDNGSLTISSVHPSDQGMFQCRLNNNISSETSSTWLKVISKEPIIVTPPTFQTAVVGSSATFTCSSRGAPSPRIRWYLSPDPAPSDHAPSEIQPSKDRRFTIADSPGPHSTLTVVTVGQAVAGYYTCNATSDTGSAAATARLVVTERTRISRGPQNRNLVKGSLSTLRCEVSHSPSVTVHWAWIHENKHIPHNDTRRKIISTGSLQILTVMDYDMGWYECRVTSVAGNDSSKAYITITMTPHAPFITSVKVDPVSKHTVIVKWSKAFDGNSPIIRFIIQYRQVLLNEPSQGPDEGWVLASDQIAASDLEYKVTSGLRPAKVYQFRIAAVNNLGQGAWGNAQQSVTLPQQPPSSPPSNVVVTAISTLDVAIDGVTTAKLSVAWNAPPPNSWNGPLKGFVIRYKLTNYDNTSARSFRVSDAHSTSHVLSGLIVWTGYDVAVASFNQAGVGRYSAFTARKTAQSKPSQSPKNLTAVSNTWSSLLLSWKPPHPSRINGDNLGYKVEYSLDDDTDTNLATKVVPVNRTNLYDLQSTVLTSLLPYRGYRCRVLCFTQPGDGPTTSWTRATTMQSVPGEVEHVNFEDILDVSLVVSWSPPTLANGILTGYRITVSTSLGQKLFTEDVSVNSRNLTVTSLVKTTDYVIGVAAMTVVGAGPSVEMTVTTGVPPVVPSTPYSLGVTSVLARSVVLQYTAGANGHARIRFISIFALSDTVTLGKWILLKKIPYDVASNTLTVDSLTPYSSYRLRLVAWNVVGPSQASESSPQFRTLASIPSRPPDAFTLLPVNSTTLDASWRPLIGSEVNGPHGGYRIHYTEIQEQGEGKSITVMGIEISTLIIVNLKPFRSYNVTVTTVNDVGSSEPSPALVGTTWESVPSVGPGSVVAEPLNSTSISVSWRPIDPKHRNGRILGFKVYYRLTNNPDQLSQYKDVNVSTATSTTLDNLLKYRFYAIKVLAYTVVGNGIATETQPVRTNEGTPGPPSRVSFPFVSLNTATVVWSPPRHPNGRLVGYRVAYRLSSQQQSKAIIKNDIASNVFSLSVKNLYERTTYIFTITARTSLGWGEQTDATVITALNRQRPDAPHRPQLATTSTDGLAVVSARSLLLTWSPPDNNGFSPLRNYTLRQKRLTVDQQPWLQLPDYISHDQLSYRVKGLLPHSHYVFSIAATNDIDMSNYSNISKKIATSSAAPDHYPLGLTLIPKSRTSIAVHWDPLPSEAWNGVSQSYSVQYRLQNTLPEMFNNSQDWTTTPGTAGTSLLVDSLPTFHAFYEFRARSVNRVGASPWSPVVLVYLQVAPSSPPLQISADVVNSTTVLVRWSPPLPQHTNGDLKAFKIYYWRPAAPLLQSELSANALSTQITLFSLLLFSEYRLVMSALNHAGEGPNSTSVQFKTNEGVPSAPERLIFKAVTFKTLMITWSPPQHLNGIILSYEISYKEVKSQSTSSGNKGEPVSSVKVILTGDSTSYTTVNLVMKQRYEFTVRANTRIGWGEPSSSMTTVGPQPGSPRAVGKPQLLLADSSVLISWSASASSNQIEALTRQKRDTLDTVPRYSGWSLVLCQAMKMADHQWKDISRENSTDNRISIPLSSLGANAEYSFRIVGVNDRGIGEPSLASDYFLVPGANSKPFYQQFWFLILIALLGLFVIVAVVTCLCFTGKLRRHKYKDGSHHSNGLSHSNRGIRLTPTLTDPDTHPSPLHHQHQSSRGATVAPLHSSSDSRTAGIYASTPARSRAPSSIITTVSDDDNAGFSTLQGRRSQRKSQRRTKAPAKSSLPPYRRRPPASPLARSLYADTKAFSCADEGEDSSSITEKAHESSDYSDTDTEKSLPPPPPEDSDNYSHHYMNSDDIDGPSTSTKWKPQLSPKVSAGELAAAALRQSQRRLPVRLPPQQEVYAAVRNNTNYKPFSLEQKNNNNDPPSLQSDSNASHASHAPLPPNHAPSESTHVTTRSNVSLDRSYDVIHPLDHSTEQLISQNSHHYHHQQPSTAAPTTTTGHHAPPTVYNHHTGYSNIPANSPNPRPQHPLDPGFDQAPPYQAPGLSYTAPDTTTTAVEGAGMGLTSNPLRDSSRTAAAKLIYGDTTSTTTTAAPSLMLGHAPLHQAPGEPLASSEPSSAYGAVLNTAGFEAGSRTPLPSYSSFV